MIVLLLIIVIIFGIIMGTIVGWDKSFGRQKTEDKWGLLPSTPPLCVLYFYHMLLLGVSVCVCYYWESMGVSVSRGYLCIEWDSSGGYLFFKKFL